MTFLSWLSKPATLYLIIKIFYFIHRKYHCLKLCLTASLLKTLLEYNLEEEWNITLSDSDPAPKVDIELTLFALTLNFVYIHENL